MTSPLLANPLGSFPGRVEFQVDRTIVQIEILPLASRSDSIHAASLLFGDIWSAIPDVLLVAARQLPTAITADLHECLAVRGIWIRPDTGTATYDVAEGFRRLAEASEFPENFAVAVVRSPDGQLSLRDKEGQELIESDAVSRLR